MTCIEQFLVVPETAVEAYFVGVEISVVVIDLVVAGIVTVGLSLVLDTVVAFAVVLLLVELDNVVVWRLPVELGRVVVDYLNLVGSDKVVVAVLLVDFDKLVDYSDIVVPGNVAFVLHLDGLDIVANNLHLADNIAAYLNLVEPDIAAVVGLLLVALDTV